MKGAKVFLHLAGGKKKALPGGQKKGEKQRKKGILQTKGMRKN